MTYNPGLVKKGFKLFQDIAENLDIEQRLKQEKNTDIKEDIVKVTGNLSDNIEIKKQVEKISNDLDIDTSDEVNEAAANLRSMIKKESKDIDYE